MPSRSSSQGPPPTPSAEDYLAVAQVRAPHGVAGELRCALITDFPERFKRTGHLYVGEAHILRTVQRSRLVKGAVLVKLDGVDTRDQAAGLRGQFLYVAAADAVDLPDGCYFWHQIIGLRVKSDGGQMLGTIRDILETGSNDVYVVGGEGTAETLLPAIHDVVLDVDLEAGEMTVKLLDGLAS